MLVLLAIVCAVLYFLAGEHEARSASVPANHNGLLWAMLSLLASFVALAGFHASSTLLLVSQVMLFICIGVVRAMLDR